MKSVITSAAVGAVVGVAAAMIAAAAGIGALGGSRAGFQKRMVHATIFLDQRGPSCVITTVPQRVEMWRNETIEWTIVDGCGVLNEPANMVQIEFKTNDPLDGGCNKRGKKWIRCPARGDAERASYEYRVLAPGAQTEDPEIEIAQ